MDLFGIFWVCFQRWPGMVPRTLRGTLQVQKTMAWGSHLGALERHVSDLWSFFYVLFFRILHENIKGSSPAGVTYICNIQHHRNKFDRVFYKIQHHLNDLDGVCYKYNNIATHLIFFIFFFYKMQHHCNKHPR